MLESSGVPLKTVKYLLNMYAKYQKQALAPGPPVAPRNFPTWYLPIYSDSNWQDVLKNHLDFDIAIWKRVAIKVQSWQNSDNLLEEYPSSLMRPICLPGILQAKPSKYTGKFLIPQ